jgi:hypothetical protein
MKIAIFFIVFALFSISDSFGQDTIFLKNPSFEGEPAYSTSPKGWEALGQKGESAVDIQPGAFGVVTKAAHGKTYLGMVVRDNNTWEIVQQKLPTALKKDSVYSFSVTLAKSDTLLSYSRAEMKENKKRKVVQEEVIMDVETPEGGLQQMPSIVRFISPIGDKVNYNQPVILQIWGGNEKYKLEELLAKSPLIDHSNWIKYRFQLQPKERYYQYIFLEAFYEDGKPVYNGNILIDNCSPIIQIKPTTNN